MQLFSTFSKICIIRVKPFFCPSVYMHVICSLMPSLLIACINNAKQSLTKSENLARIWFTNPFLIQYTLMLDIRQDDGFSNDKMRLMIILCIDGTSK